MNLKTEAVELDQTAVLADLSQAEAEILQSAAWASHQDVKRHGGYRKLPELPLPGVAPLPKGAPLSGIAGDWTGTISFYPVGPVEMSLRLMGDPVR